jgi:DNA-binding NarL/FixJ family response regulator
MTVSILLADDHQVVRLGVRTLLEAEPDFRIVGEAASGLEAKSALERLKPDVLVIDLMMPGLNGLEVTRQAASLSPKTRVIVLSMQANQAYVLEALRHGAAGYVLKQSDLTELVKAVRVVLAGRDYLSAELTQIAIEAYKERALAVARDTYDTLTTREREVLQLAAEGLTNPEIAEKLVVSPRTVEMHRGNLMRKLNLSNQTELVRYAIWRGLLPTDQTYTA